MNQNMWIGMGAMIVIALLIATISSGSSHDMPMPMMMMGMGSGHGDSPSSQKTEEPMDHSNHNHSGNKAGKVDALALPDTIQPANIDTLKNGKLELTCPVTGEKAIAKSGTVFSDYQGKRYFFCCADCKTPFEKNPEKFIKSEHHENHHEE